MGTMRVADLIAKVLADSGLRQVFMVTGGGAMHLNDAFGRHKGFDIVYNHHEQASAMAAEAYARLSGIPAVVNVTTGPGGINALNGVFGAFTDSIPMVVISGQVKRETIARNYSTSLRQLGDQEVDIVEMARPITKFCTILQNPQDVLRITEMALHIATSGRPGPVWIDVPVDVQASQVNVSDLVAWDRSFFSLIADEHLHPNTRINIDMPDEQLVSRSIDQLLDRLAASRRPVILVGTGVRIANSHQQFLKLVERLGIAVVTAFNAHDILPDDHPSYAGRAGTVGNRAGNFAVQNADFLLILGCRLNIRQISYNWKSFGARAWKVQVDVDITELDKPTLSTDLKIHADLAAFFRITELKTHTWTTARAHHDYLEWCRQRVERYPVVLPHYWTSLLVNPYCFMSSLFATLRPDEVVVTANATACVVAFQAGLIKSATRLFSNSGSASMGYDLPAAIGAAKAADGRRIICLAGDGSFMMNLQELQTIRSLNLPVVIFLLNNNGYHSIRQTQAAYFSDNLHGIDKSNGVEFPNFEALASAFRIAYFKLQDHDHMEAALSSVLSQEGPIVCEVVLDPLQEFAPKLASRKLEDGTMVSPSLEDMAPFLPREELSDNTVN